MFYALWILIQEQKCSYTNLNRVISILIILLYWTLWIYIFWSSLTMVKHGLLFGLFVYRMYSKTHSPRVTWNVNYNRTNRALNSVHVWPWSDMVCCDLFFWFRCLKQFNFYYMIFNNSLRHNWPWHFYNLLGIFCNDFGMLL